MDDAIKKPRMVAVEEATKCDAKAIQVAGKKPKNSRRKKCRQVGCGTITQRSFIRTLGKLLVALRESMSTTKNSRNEATWRKREVELCGNDDRPYYAVNIYEYLVAHSIGSAEQAEAEGQHCTVKVRDAAKTWKNNLAPKTDASEERKNATSNKPQVEGNGDIDPPIQDNEGSGGGPIANASTAPHKADKTQPAAGKPRKPNIQRRNWMRHGLNMKPEQAPSRDCRTGSRPSRQWRIPRRTPCCVSANGKGDAPH